MRDFFFDPVNAAMSILAAFLVALIAWAVYMAGQPQECTVIVNMNAVTLHSGQLATYPNTQILCVNGNVTISTRIADNNP